MKPGKGWREPALSISKAFAIAFHAVVVVITQKEKMMSSMNIHKVASVRIEPPERRMLMADRLHKDDVGTMTLTVVVERLIQDSKVEESLEITFFGLKGQDVDLKMPDHTVKIKEIRR